VTYCTVYAISNLTISHTHDLCQNGLSVVTIVPLISDLHLAKLSAGRPKLLACKVRLTEISPLV